MSIADTELEVASTFQSSPLKTDKKAIAVDLHVGRFDVFEEIDLINPARLRLERTGCSSAELRQICGSGGDRAAGALANRLGYRPGVLQQAWDGFVDQEDLGDKVFNWNPGGILAV